MSELTWMVRNVQRAVLWVHPGGGQSRARRNAWAGMVADSQRRAERVEAERSVVAAQAEALRPAVAVASG